MVIEENRNPWFIQNTTAVNYCIVVDNAHFSLPIDEITLVTEKAIEYWKDEFARIEALGYPKTPGFENLRIATQSFTEIQDCNSADIKFQFGHLEGEQFKHISNPKKTIGTSARTHYDRVSMKGKGFIYVAADSGPLGLKMEGMIENHGHTQ